MQTALARCTLLRSHHHNYRAFFDPAADSSTALSILRECVVRMAFGHERAGSLLLVLAQVVLCRSMPERQLSGSPRLPVTNALHSGEQVSAHFAPILFSDAI